MQVHISELSPSERRLVRDSMHLMAHMIAAVWDHKRRIGSAKQALEEFDNLIDEFMAEHEAEAAELADTKPDVEQLADEFSRLLLEEIGEEKLRCVIRRNKAEEFHNSCHSHDFTDANQIMDAALKNLRLPGSDTALINEAWERARWNHFNLPYKQGEHPM